MKLKGNWKYLGGSVYESGFLRIHVGAGVIEKIGGEYQFIPRNENWALHHKALLIFGGNKKRALMYIAENLQQRKRSTKQSKEKIMKKLTDFEICERIAKICGFGFSSIHGLPAISLEDDNPKLFNPITDKLLCYRLSIEHEVMIDYWHKSVYMVDEKGAVTVFLKWKNKTEIPRLSMLAIVQSDINKNKQKKV